MTPARTIARARSGDADRRSSTEANTAPPSASTAPTIATTAGRSPVASETPNGTTALHAAIGETTLIVPSDSAL